MVARGTTAGGVWEVRAGGDLAERGGSRFPTYEVMIGTGLLPRTREGDAARPPSFEGGEVGVVAGERAFGSGFDREA